MSDDSEPSPFQLNQLKKIDALIEKGKQIKRCNKKSLKKGQICNPATGKWNNDTTENRNKIIKALLDVGVTSDDWEWNNLERKEAKKKPAKDDDEEEEEEIEVKVDEKKHKEKVSGKSFSVDKVSILPKTAEQYNNMSVEDIIEMLMNRNNEQDILNVIYEKQNDIEGFKNSDIYKELKMQMSSDNINVEDLGLGSSSAFGSNSLKSFRRRSRPRRFGLGGRRRFGFGRGRRSNKKSLRKFGLAGGSAGGIYGLQGHPLYTGVYPLAGNLIQRGNPVYNTDPMHVSTTLPTLSNIKRDYLNVSFGRRGKRSRRSRKFSGIGRKRSGHKRNLRKFGRRSRRKFGLGVPVKPTIKPVVKPQLVVPKPKVFKGF